MNLLEINSQIQAIETKHDLLRWKIDSWSAWPILRFNLAAIASNLAIDTTDIRLTLTEQVMQSFHDASGFLRAKHPQVLLYVASSNRVEQENNHYKDIIFDELLQHIPTYFKIEVINNKFYLDRSHNALYPSQMTSSAIFLVTIFLSKFFPLRSINRLAEVFFEAIHESMPASTISLRHIRGVLTSYYWRKIVYRYLLHHLHPRVLLLQTAYMNHALVAAAKELNIKVIEFQHGIIDRYHPGYSWTGPAAFYKKQMPIPDLIFVYGDYWREELSVNGFWNEELRSVGSLRLDQYRSYLESNINDENKPGFLGKKIVVTTQSLEVDRLISFLLEFVKSSIEPIEIDIKLHPRESNRQPYENSFRDYPNVHIISGHESPSTFQLLSNADYHVSIHSTCHYEALGLGKPTIILPFSNYERVLPLCEKAPGYAFLARTPSEMSQIITQVRKVPAEISSYYFRVGALSNILTELHLEGN